MLSRMFSKVYPTSGPAAVSASDVRPVTVLAVEDEADQRELLALSLRRAGCEVVAAETAEAGLTQIEGVPLDLAVIDLRLPGMTGWELVQELHSRRPQLPVAVTSVLDRESYPSGSAALPKPFTNAKLRAVLSDLVPRWNAP